MWYGGCGGKHHTQVEAPALTGELNPSHDSIKGITNILSVKPRIGSLRWRERESETEKRYNSWVYWLYTASAWANEKEERRRQAETSGPLAAFCAAPLEPFFHRSIPSIPPIPSRGLTAGRRPCRGGEGKEVGKGGTRSTSNLRQGRRLTAANGRRCQPQPRRQLAAGSVPAPKGLSECAHPPCNRDPPSCSACYCCSWEEPSSSHTDADPVNCSRSMLGSWTMQKLRRAEASPLLTRVLEDK